MAITYTNRKGRTFYLGQGTTKTGKVRYYFTSNLIDESLDQVPKGYRISESVNGIVSLVKDQPPIILPQEVDRIEAALARHPKGRNYRVAVQKNQIVVYEQLGPDVDSLSEIMQNFIPLPSGVMKKRVQEQLDKMARYSPILRFILTDPKERFFKAKLLSYNGDVDDWINVGDSDKLDKLVRQIIPKLGIDDLFGLG
jgi:hypothetical protein